VGAGGTRKIRKTDRKEGDHVRVLWRDWVREEELERQRQDRQNRRRERPEEAEVQVNQEGPNRGQEP
jgi:hypothetical protein